MFRKAERKRAKLRLGISAPAGAGKTLGSLLIAYGIVRSTHPEWSEDQIWGKIALIDTEEGSGELYVGTKKHGVTVGEFLYKRISAPFSVAKYIEALHGAERAGAEVVIEDSISHAWAASGGILDKQGQIADRSKNSYTAWRFVTPEHNAFIDSMLQSPAHIIATMRSKTEYVMEVNEKGRQQPRKVGMAPVQREGMEFEFTVVFDISFDSVARAIKDRTDLFSRVDGAGRLERREFMITSETGSELYNWLNTGAEVQSLEILCEKLSADILSSNCNENLVFLYEKSLDLRERIAVEKPEWTNFIENLFTNRAEEVSKF